MEIAKLSIQVALVFSSFVLFWIEVSTFSCKLYSHLFLSHFAFIIHIFFHNHRYHQLHR